MITTHPHECRWLLGMVELNNGRINYRFTLEAFAAIHILESFPQLKCEILSLIHEGRCSTSVYQLRQLVKSIFLIGGYSRNETLFGDADLYCLQCNYRHSLHVCNEDSCCSVIVSRQSLTINQHTRQVQAIKMCFDV